MEQKEIDWRMMKEYGAWNEMPNSKQSKIEKRNKGKDYASKIEPKTTQLQENERIKRNSNYEEDF
ncbi:MAG: hypothetical protein N4A72_20210 [Bacteroidales bacterium]|jgi:predicted Fe-S protein YdhL (DUF1289 family)|nr:hypothetical protein [Bacteroidales bacterium]